MLHLLEFFMRIAVSVLLVLAAGLAHARPVSYPGGKTAIVNVGSKETSSLLHYTFDAKTSVGLRSILRDGFRTTIQAVEVNHLAWRDNGEDHQANLYLRGGLGIAALKQTGQPVDFKPVVYAGIAADWENRKYFISYENRFETIGGHNASFNQAARVGFAPYVGEYGDLHTWLMLELRHHPQDAAGSFSVKPLVRLFKGVHLVELGVTSRGDIEGSWIGRF